MKKTFLILLLIFEMVLPALAGVEPPEECGIPLVATPKIGNSKRFTLNTDNTFMLAVGAVNQAGFSIVEIQSSSGYILFKTSADNEYLITVTAYGRNNTMTNVEITKVKNQSPLTEIQDIIFSIMEKNANNLPKKVQQGS